MAGPAARHDLFARLRELRESQGMTQKQLALELDVSAALVSSWENGGVVPLEHRLGGYASLFAHSQPTRNLATKSTRHELSVDEEQSREALNKELIQLRRQAVASTREGGLWSFSDNDNVTIICTPMPTKFRTSIDYASNLHPNYIRALFTSDLDALIELYGHIRAENPSARVEFISIEDVQSSDELTGHLVILGSADSLLLRSSPLRWLLELLMLPVETQLPEGGDAEYDAEFVISVDQMGQPMVGGPERVFLKPEFQRNAPLSGGRGLVQSYPQLKSDIAFMARRPNPFNVSATFTWCAGIFSRGTYGAVRALTDVEARHRNEQYIYTNFEDPSNFWLLVNVPVIAGGTLTPDFANSSQVLFTSANEKSISVCQPKP